MIPLWIGRTAVIALSAVDGALVDGALDTRGLKSVVR